jgi:hypothetical protein
MVLLQFDLDGWFDYKRLVGRRAVVKSEKRGFGVGTKDVWSVRIFFHEFATVNEPIDDVRRADFRFSSRFGLGRT